MTDNEIIKALECCANHSASSNFRLTYQGQPLKLLLDNALDLINHQKAEIERLQDKLDTARREMLETIPLIEEDIKIAKAEVVKEFAERLKYRTCCIPQHHFTYAEVEQHIDYLVKEMVGEG